jgi:hypothetical protein
MNPIQKVIEESREILAELEHEQWIAWSKNIAETETISPARLKRWEKLWCPYSMLTEAQKDQDREYGDKVLHTIYKILSAIEKEVEGMKDDIKMHPDGCYCPPCRSADGWNSALSDIQSLLKSAKEQIK